MEYLQILIESLSDSLGTKIPMILVALLIVIIGYFIARLIKKLAIKLLNRTKIDEKISQKISTRFKLDQFIAKLLYYLVILYTLIIALNLMGVTGVTQSLETMLGEFLNYIPNIIGAGIIIFLGYIIASLASEAISFISASLEKFSGKIGLNSKTINLSKLIKQLVFIIVFIPILIVALDTLEMKAISEPATSMLSSLLNAIPNILAAAILLGIFYLIGKYITNIVTTLLHNLGLDTLSNKIGIQTIIGTQSLSKIIGNIALFFIMFTGIIAASEKLQLNQVETILTTIFNISGRIFFGIVILMAGVYLSNIVKNALAKSQNNTYYIPIVRFAILGIFLAFGLHTMGIAESIVNLAFGLTLGAVAVAFALSFGLGGREAAGEEMKQFFKNLRK